MLDLTISSSQGSILFRLFFAALLGGLIGYERERSGRPAGFRTHIIVCITSALLIASLQSSMNPDSVARVIAAIMTGIGFLGAGTILTHAEKVYGLTTAATIWGMAAVGMIVGLGMYFQAVVSTFLFLIVLSLLPIEKKIIRKKRGWKNVLWKLRKT